MPSGIVVTNALEPLSASVMCTPFIPTFDPETMTIDLMGGEELRRQFGEYFVVSPEELNSYGALLPDLQETIKRGAHDAIVVPMCGAARPAAVVSAMDNFETRLVTVPFTQGSTGMHDARILEILGEGLQPLMGRDPLSLCVLDTGKGGQGLRHMARLLRELHDTCASKRLWTVKFNVIVPENRRDYLDKTNDVKCLVTEKFKVERQVFRAQELIGEDSKQAAGYAVHWEERGANVIQQTSTQGALIIKRQEHLEVLPEVDINAAINDKICEAVTSRLMYGPDNYFAGDIWDFNYEVPKIDKILGE